MSKSIQYTILLFLQLTFFIGFSQPKKLQFDHLFARQGLSQENVSDIYQDRLGFIWIGTEDGLNLYDGYSFTIFKKKE